MRHPWVCTALAASALLCFLLSAWTGQAWLLWAGAGDIVLVLLLVATTPYEER